MSERKEIIPPLRQAEIFVLETIKDTGRMAFGDYEPLRQATTAFDRLQEMGLVYRGVVTSDGEDYLERLKYPWKVWLKENWFPVAVLVVGPIVSGLVVYGLDRILP